MTAPQAFALALQHHQAGRLKEAEALYREVLAVQPDHVDALQNLGVIAEQMGRHDFAVTWLQRALAIDPANASAHYNLGEVHRAAGRCEEAVAAYRRAIALQPDFADAFHNLGLALSGQGRIDEAIEAYRQALVRQPEYAEAHNNLGNALREQGRFENAVAAYRRALEIRPDSPEIHTNLGTALAQQGRFDEAMREYQAALQLRPDFPDTYNDLGKTFRRQGRFDEAVAAFRRALELRPEFPDAANNLGNSLKDLGQMDGAVAAYRHATEIQPRNTLFHSNLVYALQCHPTQDTQMLAEEWRRWNERICGPLRGGIRPHPNERNGDRRLRVGYVSPDFRFNAVSFFLTPLLEKHDHRAHEIFCYASVLRPDAVTQRLRNAADVWRDVRTLSDAQLAELVRNDGIDILVDLAMHTGGNRLLAFAHQPAPVQVSWLAYPGSTGLEMIDYRLTDAQIEPAEPRVGNLGEVAIRLPDSWCCYEPIEQFPPVSSLPAARNGVVTFGSFNYFGKIHEGLLHCWASLLGAVSGSRLLLICPEGQARQKTRAIFTAHGVSEERVELVGRCPWKDYVRLFEKVDVALDSYPCNGMTTTCHTLWMGVPVVTRAGATSVSRAGSSLLHTIGLPEWVADSEEVYLRIATEAARDLPRLVELRRTLRTRMQRSPLMDAPRFARHMEAAYRAMWRRWCEEKRS